jgi:hypothetical protein
LLNEVADSAKENSGVDLLRAYEVWLRPAAAGPKGSCARAVSSPFRVR